MNQRKAVPFWLGDGSEACAICTHTYALQMEYRCAACDRGVCEHCAILVRETREVLCATCRWEEED